MPTPARRIGAALRRDDGVTMVAATSVLAIVLVLGAVVSALAVRSAQQSVVHRDATKAQLAAEGALDAAQYVLSKTAGGLLGKADGGSFLSLRRLDRDLANALCLSVDVGTGAPLLDAGNPGATMCPEGEWEPAGDDTEMLVRQQELGLLAPNAIVSRIVVGIGRSGRAGARTTRRMIMRLELRLDDLGNLSLVRRRGVAVCRGAYRPAAPAEGCPQPPSPPVAATAGSPTDPGAEEPVDPGPAPSAPSLVLVPHVDGTPEVGETLTVIPGQWRHQSGDAVRRYEWFRCPTDDGACTSVAGPSTTATRYALPAGEYGSTRRWKVRETVVNNPGTAQERSSSAWSLATVSGQAHIGAGGSVYSATVRSPRIVGTAKAGRTLTADGGAWDSRGVSVPILDLLPQTTQDWWRCPATGSPDATSATTQSISGCVRRGSLPTFTPNASDVGSRMRTRTTNGICAVSVLVLCFGRSNDVVVSQATGVVAPAD